MSLKKDKPEYGLKKTFLGEIEHIRAWFENHRFSRHYHDGYGVGVIEKGAMEFFYRGEKNLAPQGFVNTVSPGEVHDGHSGSAGGWVYRMIYFKPEVFSNACRMLFDKDNAEPVIQEGVVADMELLREIYSAYDVLSDKSSGNLEADSALTSVFSLLIERHCGFVPLQQKVYKLGMSLSKVKEYVNSFYMNNISLTELSDVANVSPFHFTRSFKSDTGLTPTEYLTQVRVNKAMELLSKGVGAAEVALETGFSDQSHLIRKFKKQTGITPRQFSKT